MGNNQTKFKATAIRVTAERDKDIEAHIKTLKTLSQQCKITEELIKTVVNAHCYELVDLLNKGKITSKQLVVIFSLRAATFGRQLNLITQDNFALALTMADICDETRLSTKKTNWTFTDEWNLQKHFPPLFGIPISIKDMFHVQGKRTTVGITARSHIIQEQDGQIVKCFKNSGMIPFVKTNVPQMAMIFQSTNYLWGRSLNVWNTKRSVGGSSGGEAGLIAAKCSPIGIGSDIGGSLRIPAQFCGIYSLKSCEQRLSTNHLCYLSDLVLGKDTIKPVNGPMGTCVDDLALWMKVVTHEDFYKGDHDPFHKAIPFDEKTYLKSTKKRGKIGYYKDLYMSEATPAAARAVDESVAILKDLGYEVVEVKIPNDVELVQQYIAELSAEGKARGFMELLEGEEPIDQYKKGFFLTKLPNFLIKFGAAILKIFKPRMGLLAEKGVQLTTSEYFNHAGNVVKHRYAFIQFWKENNLDYIICPGFGCHANTHGTSEWLAPVACHTFIYNLLGLPVGSMPVTLVKQDQQHYESQFNDIVTRTLRANAADSKGLPVGIQVVGLPFQEEKVLALMKVLQEKIQFTKKFDKEKDCKIQAFI